MSDNDLLWLDGTQRYRAKQGRLLIGSQRGRSVDPVGEAVVIGVPRAQDRVALQPPGPVQVPQLAPFTRGENDAPAVLDAHRLIRGQGSIPVWTGAVCRCRLHAGDMLREHP